jgi:hypothetical protein
MTTDTPRHQHDCTNCTFLGHHGAADLYFCGKQLSSYTLIARHSSEGADYNSGTCFSYGANPALHEARLRAQAIGLMEYNLQEALHAMSPKATAECKHELHEALSTSEIGQALMLLAENPTAGKSAVRHIIDNQAAAYQAKFPDKDLESLKAWARTHVTNAQDWLHRLALPHAQQSQFAEALYGA